MILTVTSQLVLCSDSPIFSDLSHSDLQNYIMKEETMVFKANGMSFP